jgi:hypothetical protein
MDTNIAHELISEAEVLGAVINGNTQDTSKGFIRAAVDNIDLLEETLDGLMTTHSTTIVLYQSSNYFITFSYLLYV